MFFDELSPGGDAVLNDGVGGLGVDAVDAFVAEVEEVFEESDFFCGGEEDDRGEAAFGFILVEDDDAGTGLLDLGHHQFGDGLDTAEEEDAVGGLEGIGDAGVGPVGVGIGAEGDGVAFEGGLDALAPEFDVEGEDGGGEEGDDLGVDAGTVLFGDGEAAVFESGEDAVVEELFGGEAEGGAGDAERDGEVAFAGDAADGVIGMSDPFEEKFSGGSGFFRGQKGDLRKGDIVRRG